MLVWALLLTVGISSSFANFTGTVSQYVINAFKKDFASAQDVSWEQGKTFAKATFKMNEQVMFAYYTAEGELAAVTRNIQTAQLPINLLTTLKKNYEQYWITDLFEMAANNSTSYYITVENDDHRLILKSSGTTGWEVFKKEKRNAQ